MKKSLRKYWAKNINAVSDKYWVYQAQRHAENVFHKAWLKNNGVELMKQAYEERHARFIASLPKESELPREDCSWGMVRKS